MYECEKECESMCMTIIKKDAVKLSGSDGEHVMCLRKKIKGKIYHAPREGK